MFSHSILKPRTCITSHIGHLSLLKAWCYINLIYIKNCIANNLKILTFFKTQNVPFPVLFKNESKRDWQTLIFIHLWYRFPADYLISRTVGYKFFMYIFQIGTRNLGVWHNVYKQRHAFKVDGIFYLHCYLGETLKQEVMWSLITDLTTWCVRKFVLNLTMLKNANSLTDYWNCLLQVYTRKHRTLLS